MLGEDPKQKIEHVFKKLRSWQSGPLLVQFWTSKIWNGRYSLKTRNSPFFLVTYDDTLCVYRVISSDRDINLYGKCEEDTSLPGSVFYSQKPSVWSANSLASLCLPVNLLGCEPPPDPIRPKRKLSYQNCVGILEIVSNSKELCLQFFKEARVCDLFQKEGLICSDAGLEHLGMQLDVSTQGSEVPSTFLENHTRQFTTEQVFNKKDELLKWVHGVAKNNGFGVAIKSSAGGKKPRIYLACKSGQYQATKMITGAKKCKCTFTVKASATNEKWSLEVIDGWHNHPLVKHHEG
ncbi:hypothetical protein ACSBR2_035019 [Camellia fascicularis]